MDDFKAKLRAVLKTGSTIAQTAVHLTTTTTTLGKAAAVVSAVSALMGEESSLASDYTRHGAKSLHMPEKLGRAIFALLRDRVVDVERRGKEIAYELDCAVAWIVASDVNQVIGGPFALTESARETLGRALWEEAEGAIALSVRNWGDVVEVSKDALCGVAPSTIASDLIERTRLFNAEGINRSVLLHGPPGTGKSYAMRTVAAGLGGFSVRFSSAWGGTEHLEALVELIAPRAVLMDDIDRYVSQWMLDTMERLKQSTSIVLGSANYTGELDPALRRPGRFDESILVERLDDEVLERVLGDAPQVALKKLRDLPIAYIQEYAQTRRVVGEVAAAARLDDLVALAREVGKAEPKSVDTTTNKTT